VTVRSDNPEMDIPDSPPLNWRILNDKTHVASKDGRVVAITYTVDAGEVNGAHAIEFCWIPVDEPDLVDVHFGFSEGAGPAWDGRWDRARRATEWDYARRSGT
jgi:hypothetical protein